MKGVVVRDHDDFQHTLGSILENQKKAKKINCQFKDASLTVNLCPSGQLSVSARDFLEFINLVIPDKEFKYIKERERWHEYYIAELLDDLIEYSETQYDEAVQRELATFCTTFRAFMTRLLADYLDDKITLRLQNDIERCARKKRKLDELLRSDLITSENVFGERKKFKWE